MQEVISSVQITNDTKLSTIEKAVIKTLLYFDIFRYPLKVEELFTNCHEQLTTYKDIEQAIASLIKWNLIKVKNDFIYVNNDDRIIERRIEGNKKAIPYLKKARTFSKFISNFPFVEAIFISGSLSKDMVDEKGDIDYFIITKPNRLWLCRTSLIAFKKIFLLNSKKYFCVNYFIDSSNIVIPDKNIFTATELAFAKPMYNATLSDLFFEANIWKNIYYPNKTKTDTTNVHPINSGILKRTSEWMFEGKIGEKLDTWCFKNTLKHWKKKFPEFDEARFDLNLRSRKNVSKHHPSAFQERVLKQLQQKIEDFEKEYNVQLK